MFEVTLRSDRCFVDVSVGFISVSSISKESGSSFPWPGAIGVVTLGTEVQSEGGGEIHMVYENRLQILDNLTYSHILGTTGSWLLPARSTPTLS